MSTLPDVNQETLSPDLIQRLPADMATFEHVLYGFEACRVYNERNPLEVRYNSKYSKCFLGMAHTILAHFQSLLFAEVFPVGLWIVPPEDEQLYREREQTWWQKNAQGHPWKEEYSQTPHW
jgi:hypothetical protein